MCCDVCFFVGGHKINFFDVHCCLHFIITFALSCESSWTIISSFPGLFSKSTRSSANLRWFSFTPSIFRPKVSQFSCLKTSSRTAKKSLVRPGILVLNLFLLGIRLLTSLLVFLLYCFYIFASKCLCKSCWLSAFPVLATFCYSLKNRMFCFSLWKSPAYIYFLYFSNTCVSVNIHGSKRHKRLSF